MTEPDRTSEFGRYFTDADGTARVETRPGLFSDLQVITENSWPVGSKGDVLRLQVLFEDSWKMVEGNTPLASVCSSTATFSHQVQPLIASMCCTRIRLLCLRREPKRTKARIDCKSESERGRDMFRAFEPPPPPMVRSNSTSRERQRR